VVLAGILLLISGVISTRTYPVFTDVFIGSHGPYKFLVDTGAETSVLDPKLASDLKLQPAFRVEVVTQQSKRLLPGTRLRTMRVGQTALPEIEVIFQDLTEPRRVAPAIKGVLGLNVLAAFDFSISPLTGQLEIAPQRPAGETVSFQRVDGRIALKARMGREILTLLLDSGSNHIVLFRTPEAMAKTPPVAASFTTLEGARRAVPTTWTADLYFNDRLKVGMQPAAIVERHASQADGLLPASLFKKIYVDHARKEIVLIR
jgi:hypothetical protein